MPPTFWKAFPGPLVAAQSSKTHPPNPARLPSGIQDLVVNMQLDQGYVFKLLGIPLTTTFLGTLAIGDLWMWLQLMWLRFEVVRGPVGVVSDRCGAGLGPFGPRPQPGPKPIPDDPDRTSDSIKLQPHAL